MSRLEIFARYLIGLAAVGAGITMCFYPSMSHAAWLIIVTGMALIGLTLLTSTVPDPGSPVRNI